MTFPADHPIELLRALERPKPSDIRRAVALRVAYLRDKVVRRAAAGEPAGFLLDELAALAVLAETYDATQAERAHPDDAESRVATKAPW